ncbi:MAG: periplasmic C4-dicarboxylate binding protein DctP [bacterium]|nr:periplasmic C4-dicarboxylate binding protein DctP [bacterium]
MRFFASLLLVTLVTLASPSLRAEPTVRLRFGAIAPDGTGWAREVKAFAREIETASNGRLGMRVYLGGIAGDDSEMGRRMRKDQLDGALSAGMLCQEVAPAFAVFRIPGLVQDRAEESYVQTRLLPTLRKQARANGMVLLTTGSLGTDVVLSRVPIDSLDGLRKLRIWQWDLDLTSIAFTRAIGMHPVPLPVTDAGRAYEEGKTDGFLAIPSAIFGFQWFSQRVYMYQFPFAPLHGCALMSATTYERLPADLREVVETASVKFGLRIGETTRAQDEELLGGLFAKQGVRSMPVSPLLRAQFLDAAHAARDRLGTQLVPRELLLQVQSFLADYRSEHH